MHYYYYSDLKFKYEQKLAFLHKISIGFVILVNFFESFILVCLTNLIVKYKLHISLK